MTGSLVASEGTVLATLADRDAVHDGRKGIADLVSGFADDTRFATRRPELRALAAALKAGGSRESVWHGIELEQTFTPETTIRLTPRKRRRVAGAIGALAAIVVFLPVWWTWWSFQAATNAYQRVLDAGQAEGESFLQLWSTGFLGQLPEHHWLPNVALWSATLILACILLIVGERLMTRSAERADDDEYQECSAGLASALNLAQITINSRDIRDPIQGLDIIREAVEQLLAAHQQTREAAGVLRDAAVDLEGSTSRVTAGLESSTATLLATYQQGIDDLLKSISATMTGTAATLLGSVGGVTQTLERSVTQASDTLESSLTTAVDSLNASVGQVAQASTGMHKAITASTSAQQELAQATADLAANTQAIEATLRAQIQSSADSISREVEQLRAEAGNLAQNTGQVGSSLGHHTSALQHQITELTQIRASLERVSRLGATGEDVVGAGLKGR